MGTNRNNTYYIDAKFKHLGKTKLILIDKNGNKEKIDLTIGINTYSLDIGE